MRTDLTCLTMLVVSVPLFGFTARAAQGSYLLVGSSSSGNIRRYDGATGASIDTFVAHGTAGLSSSFSMDIGPDANLYVSNFSANKVLRFDSLTGAFINDFVGAGSGLLNQTYGVTFGPDKNLYVASFNTGDVKRYNGLTGAFVDNFASGMNKPARLTFGPDGKLYVSSYVADLVYRADGTTVVPFISGLDAAGLRFGPDNNLYVANTAGNNVQRYDGTTGAFIDVFASGSGLSQPTDLTFGPDGHLYVSSTTRVMRYNGTTGDYIDDFVSGGSGGLANAMQPLFTSPTNFGTFASFSSADDLDLQGQFAYAIHCNAGPVSGQRDGVDRTVAGLTFKTDTASIAGYTNTMDQNYRAGPVFADSELYQLIRHFRYRFAPSTGDKSADILLDVTAGQEYKLQLLWGDTMTLTDVSINDELAFAGLCGTTGYGKVFTHTFRAPSDLLKITIAGHTTANYPQLSALTLEMVPEPGSLLLLGMGLVSLVIRRPRKK